MWRPIYSFYHIEPCLEGSARGRRYAEELVPETSRPFCCKAVVRQLVIIERERENGQVGSLVFFRAFPAEGERTCNRRSVVVTLIPGAAGQLREVYVSSWSGWVDAGYGHKLKVVFGFFMELKFCFGCWLGQRARSPLDARAVCI
jgi:hypothetical protein